MAIDAPRSQYETAWQQWNYGGRMRGEPMPRIEDYPETFGQNQRPAPMGQSPMTPQRLPRAPEPRFPMDERRPDGSDPSGGYGSFPQRPQRTPEPRFPMDERRPDGSDPRGGYAGGNLPYGGDLNTGQYSGYGSFPKPLNTGMPKPGGMMNPMTLGQLNRRRPY